MLLDDQLKLSASDFRSNKTQIALQRLDEVIYEKPYEISAYINKSSILAANQQYQQAQITLKKGIQICPYDYRGHFNMFSIFLKQKKYRQALHSLKYTLSTLNVALSMQCKENQRQFLQKSELYWKNNISAYIVGAAHYNDLKKMNEALQVISKGIQYCGDNGLLLSIRASIYFANDEFQKALKDLQNRQKVSKIQQNQINYDWIQVQNMDYKQQIQKYVQQLNLLLKFEQDYTSKMYFKPQNILFIQKIANKTIDIDQIINNTFSFPELDIVKQKLRKTQAIQYDESQKNRSQNIDQQLIQSKKVQSSKDQQVIPNNKQIKQMNLYKSQNLYPLKNYKNIMLTVNAALITHNTQLIGNMDPYIMLNYVNNQKYRTKTLKSGGQKPVWKNQTKLFKLPASPGILKVEVWDHQTFKRDDFVGKGSIYIKETGQQSIQIFNGTKSAGNVFIKVEGLK